MPDGYNERMNILPQKLGFDRGMTSREKSIVEYIRQKLKESGYPPTVREISEAVGLRSTSTVHSYLGRLERLGIIRRNPASSRAIELTEDIAWRRKKIIPTPVVESVHTGKPIVASERVETVLPLPAELIGNQDSFILIARGDCMIKAGISEGDLLVTAQQNTACNGDIVVALVGSDDATVRRFFKEADHIRLQPENDEYEPIISNEVTILGKVVGLFRHY